MTKHSGANKVLLIATLVTFTLGLTSTVDVLGAFASAHDDFQAPRVIHSDSSLRDNDPLQAPRAEVGRGDDAAWGKTAEL